MNRQEFIEYVVRARMGAYPWASVEGMAKDAAAAWEILSDSNQLAAHVSHGSSNFAYASDYVPGPAGSCVEQNSTIPDVDVGLVANIATTVEVNLMPIIPRFEKIFITLHYSNGKRTTMKTYLDILRRDGKVTLAVPQCP